MMRYFRTARDSTQEDHQLVVIQGVILARTIRATVSNHLRKLFRFSKSSLFLQL